MTDLARSRVFWLSLLLVLGVAGYLSFAVFGVHTLFTNTEVNEEFATQENTREAQEEQGETAAPEEEEQPAGPVAVTSGRFHDVEYSGTGEATVYQKEDGSYVLRLEDLDVENGPDLYVYAVAAPDANDADTVLEAGFLDLGRLKGNRGNQTYELPADFDPQMYRSVSIWCRAFTANFVTAPLS
jgi:hypothetical protein